MNYVLYGEEQYLLQEALSKIVQEHGGAAQDFNTITYDALKSNTDMLLEDAQTVPFFAEHKIIIVQNANFLSTSDDTGWELDALSSYFDHPLESTVLVLVGEFAKLDARKKIVKKIQKTCKVLQFRKLDDMGKQRYIMEQIQKRQLTVEPRALQALYTRIPNDIRMIRNECDKLELYGDVITERVVEHLVARPLEEDVFQLVNAVVEKRIKEAFHLWEDMCTQNKDAIYLIAMLSSQFRFLYQVKELMLEGKYKEEITSILSAHPYRVQVSMKTAQLLDIAELLSILDRLAVLDQEIKAGRMNKVIGFEMFLLSLRGV